MRSLLLVAAVLTPAFLGAGCKPTTPQIVPIQESSATMTTLMTWEQLLAQPKPSPTHTITWGPGATDVADLWLPAGAGPHPVVLMVHGGCWQKSIADRTLMNWAAEDLQKQGLAVWNIEYRGVDEEGGGYPGTFLDVARAADALRDQAVLYNLRIDHIAAFGHSAGGHLALWLAARPKLPMKSPLRVDNPIRITGVVNSGGLADLEASAPVTQRDCLADILDTLTGPITQGRPNVFSDTSPAEMLPLHVKQVSINGHADRIAPPVLGEDYTRKARAAGDHAEVRVIMRTGHVELIAPGTEAFAVETSVLKDMLR